jgi:uncharacterized protein YndB with AHSA1/START domain
LPEPVKTLIASATPAMQTVGEACDREHNMTGLKWLALPVLGLAMALVGGATLISPRYTVTRSEAIQAPPDKVYGLLVDPRSWMEWTVWKRRDPRMSVVYSGPPSGAGAALSWSSKRMGSGSLTFTHAKHNELIAYELDLASLGLKSQGELTLHSDGQWTQVTWTMRGELGGNIVRRWIALLMDPVFGRDFRDGLVNLKTLAERA